jgi:hypothetical protein
MSEPLNEPSATSVLNSLANMGVDVSGAEPLTSVDTFRIASTGAQAKTDFLYQPYNEAWPEARKLEWEKFNMLEIGTTPAKMATDMTETLKAERNAAAETMKEQRKRELAASDPAARADLSAKQADAAAKQLALQDAYLQEMEYQSHIGTITNPQASRSERMAAIGAIDGLALAIGRRIGGSGGASAKAIDATKKSIGYINWMQEFNPAADYGPQADSMRRGSENRIGVIRQQMEAAGVPVPEFKGAATAPADPAQTVLQRFSVKAPDGNAVMFEGSPVISIPRAGKQVFMRQAPSGGFVELTEQQAAALRGQ